MSNVEPMRPPRRLTPSDPQCAVCGRHPNNQPCPVIEREREEDRR